MTNATLFISDLHLSEKHPKISELFLKFLDEDAPKTDALYILGDLFEYWIGDDVHSQNAHDQKICQALANFSSRGIPLYFMHGNRDFLIGKQFLKTTGCTLLPDPTVIQLYGKPVLLMHGDSLCTNDKAYQRFRAFVRNPVTRKFFLSLPFFLRRKIAMSIRAKSYSAKKQNQKFKESKAYKEPSYWDVSQSTVLKTLNEQKTQTLIHGHTHKPGIHDFSVNGTPAKRIVLGDWGDTGSVLVVSADNAELRSFA